MMKRFQFIPLHILCGLWACMPLLAQDNVIERPFGILFEPDTRETLKKQIAIGHLTFQGEMKRRMGINVALKTYEDHRSYHRDLEAGLLFYGVVSTHRYVTDLESNQRISPLFTPMLSENGRETFSILVSSNSTITKPIQLRGKSSSVYVNGSPEIIRAWYQSIVGQEIRELEQVESPKQAVYAAFYGQREFCIVPSQTFTTMKELNPQIGKRLLELEVSPTLPLGVVFANSNVPEAERKQMVAVIKKLRTVRTGQSVLALTRIGALAPFESSHLDGIREVFGKKQPLSAPKGGVP